MKVLFVLLFLMLGSVLLLTFAVLTVVEKDEHDRAQRCIKYGGRMIDDVCYVGPLSCPMGASDENR